VKKSSKGLKHFKGNSEYGELDGARFLDNPLPGLFIKQQVSLWELFGCEIPNKYKISAFKRKNFNSERPRQGKVILNAREKGGGCLTCMIRNCCLAARPFTIELDAAGNDAQILRFERPYHCPTECDICADIQMCNGTCCCMDCCWCGNATIGVYSGAASSKPNVFLGRVRQDCSCCYHPAYSIRNEKDEPMYIVGGECYTGCCECLRQVKFPVKKAGHQEKVGELMKVRGNFIKEFFTDADSFALTFPKDADPRQRALLLASTFMVDFMHFEKNNDNSSGGAGILSL